MGRTTNGEGKRRARRIGWKRRRDVAFDLVNVVVLGTNCEALPQTRSQVKTKLVAVAPVTVSVQGAVRGSVGVRTCDLAWPHTGACYLILT